MHLLHATLPCAAFRYAVGRGSGRGASKGCRQGVQARGAGGCRYGVHAWGQAWGIGKGCRQGDRYGVHARDAGGGSGTGFKQGIQARGAGREAGKQNSMSKLSLSHSYLGSLLSSDKRCLLAARASTRPYSVKSRPFLFTMYCSNQKLSPHDKPLQTIHKPA